MASDNEGTRQVENPAIIGAAAPAFEVRSDSDPLAQPLPVQTLLGIGERLDDPYVIEEMRYTKLDASALSIDDADADDQISYIAATYIADPTLPFPNLQFHFFTFQSESPRIDSVRAICEALPELSILSHYEELNGHFVETTVEGYRQMRCTPATTDEDDGLTETGCTVQELPEGVLLTVESNPFDDSIPDVSEAYSEAVLQLARTNEIAVDSDTLDGRDRR